MNAITINIIGAGGTGAWFSEQILRAVIGMRHEDEDRAVLINLIDNDRIELRNLVRQHFLGMESIGMTKVDYLRMKLERILAAAVVQTDPHLNTGNGYMPAIRIEAVERLVLENADGDLDEDLKEMLFPEQVAAAITVMCVDNNLTRKTLEKHYHKHVSKTREFAFDRFAESIEPVKEIIEAVAEKDFDARTAVYFIDDEEASHVRAVTRYSDGNINASGLFPVEGLKVLLSNAGRGGASASYAYIDAGNDDVDFAINGAVNTPLVDYTHVYNADLTVPDALHSCAVTEETAPVPQTATMNMMAATHLTGVVAGWIAKLWNIAELGGVSTAKGVHRETILAAMGTNISRINELRDETGSSISGIYTLRNHGLPAIPERKLGRTRGAIRKVLLTIPDGDVTDEQVIDLAGKLAAEHDQTTEFDVDASINMVEFFAAEAGTTEDDMATFWDLDPVVEAVTDGISIHGSSIHSKVIAQGATGYARMRNTLAAALAREAAEERAREQANKDKEKRAKVVTAKAATAKTAKKKKKIKEAS